MQIIKIFHCLFLCGHWKCHSLDLYSGVNKSYSQLWHWNIVAFWNICRLNSSGSSVTACCNSSSILNQLQSQTPWKLQTPSTLAALQTSNKIFVYAHFCSALLTSSFRKNTCWNFAFHDVRPRKSLFKHRPLQCFGNRWYLNGKGRWRKTQRW